ncbi:putative bifunctional diguanylate cyclase/phosphodiesterase [Egicoccus halophilus]|uniref:Two-component system response regulator n=1 Tax=Egicoccus halophilus TaxID=1670830 RepID=A0A8J3EU73_9ACTN|nr:EAL domain-containing protein [Egicoccus halophilus]GGI07097.1 two-component system response regulator [Egicoccus halophilus]
MRATETVDFAALFDALPTACLVLDRELVIVEANRTREAVTGRRREDVLGRHVFDAFPDNPQDDDATGVGNLSASLRRVLATRRPDAMPLQRYDITTGDGEVFVERYWSPVNVPVLDEHGEVALILHIVDDVTDTVRARHHLEAEEARFRALVEHASDPILIVTADRRVTYVSPAAERMLGPRSGSRDLPRWGELADPPDRQVALGLVAQTLQAEAGETLEAQLRVRLPDGRRRWVQVRATNHRGTPAIGGVVLNVRDVTEKREVEQRLEATALRDPLTGLLNRRAFLDAVRRALTRAKRSGRPVAVLLIDLDHFKTVNDSLGHAAGDRLLTDVTAHLAEALRPSDVLARLGGDEFVVLAEDLTAPSDALTVAQRLVAEAAGSYALTGTLRTRITLSVGVTTTTDGTDPAALLTQADTALYEAKRRGRNRVEVFDPALREQLLHRLHLAHDFEQALAQDRLCLHWQPITATRGGSLVGVEALLRWDHPRRGLLRPGEFLPIVEQSGLLPGLASWVLEEAVGQAATWRTALADPPRVFINLATAQLHDPGLSDEVLGLTRSHRLDPSSIVLEVSERDLDGEVGVVGDHLQQLHDRGFGVALDDFGAGGTALSWLRELPLDVLKLDRHIVAGLDDPVTEAIVRSIVELTPALGIASLAEGVETARQRALLSDLGCDYVQGHHIARPGPADDALAWAGTV